MAILTLAGGYIALGGYNSIRLMDARGQRFSLLLVAASALGSGYLFFASQYYSLSQLDEFVMLALSMLGGIAVALIVVLLAQWIRAGFAAERSDPPSPVS